MNSKLRIAFVILLLLLAAAPAHALGLGQIVVRSRPGEALLAEIPVISSDPAELQQLQARMASPETFARIGLPQPRGAAADLQFAVALDAQGRPVIRVTTATPVQQPSINFLVEVDWEQGRLVREYSVLIDTPRAVAGTAQPLVQAPVIAPPSVIARPQPLPPTLPAQRPQPAPPPVPVAVPTPAPTAIPTPAPAPITAAPPAPEPAQQYGPVAGGQTLSEIATSVGQSGFTLDQTMLALLRANPDAFIGDDINRLKRGAVLRLPQPAEVARYEAGEAAAVVRAQVERWREARRPPLQPALANALPAPSAIPARPRPATTPAVARRATARLQIAPPGDGGTVQAGTRSGLSAGGEGDMLRSDLQQTKETLAAREAELQELRGRVAELEQLQTQQQRLLTMKDSELAAAQQRLATSTTPAATPTTEAERSMPPWLWGGLIAVLLGVLGWWLLRRRSARPPPPMRSYDTAALAAGMPGARSEPVLDPSPDVSALDTFQPTAATLAPAPTWHAGSAATADGRQQIELARAYLNLGDHDAARTLLQDIAGSDDAGASEEATRLLRTLT